MKNPKQFKNFLVKIVTVVFVISSFLVFAPKTHAVAITDSLVSWYDLESDGTDATGANTLSNNTNNSYGSGSGKVGNGVSLNSNDANHSVLHKGSITDLNVGTGAFSVSGWFNRQGTGHVSSWNPPIFTAGPVGNSTGLGLFLEEDGTHIMAGQHSGATYHYTYFLVNITTTGWHHFAFVRSADTHRIALYLDNTLLTESSHTDNGGYSSVNVSDFFIGGDTDTADEFKGYTDSVGIWTRALDATDVATLYNSGNGQNYCGITGGCAVAAIIYNRKQKAIIW